MSFTSPAGVLGWDPLLQTINPALLDRSEEEDLLNMPLTIEPLDNQLLSEPPDAALIEGFGNFDHNTLDSLIDGYHQGAWSEQDWAWCFDHSVMNSPDQQQQDTPGLTHTSPNSVGSTPEQSPGSVAQVYNAGAATMSVPLVDWGDTPESSGRSPHDMTPGVASTQPKAIMTAPGPHQGHQCTVCGKKSTSRANLRKHMKNHDKTFQCPQCSWKVASPRDLKRHHLVHHASEKTVLICPHPLCGRSFSNRPDNLKRHLRNQHGEES